LSIIVEKVGDEEEQARNLNFTWETDSFFIDTLKINLTFAEPYYVSSGKADWLRVTILDTSSFIASD